MTDDNRGFNAHWSLMLLYSMVQFGFCAEVLCSCRLALHYFMMSLFSCSLLPNPTLSFPIIENSDLICWLSVIWHLCPNSCNFLSVSLYRVYFSLALHLCGIDRSLPSETTLTASSSCTVSFGMPISFCFMPIRFSDGSSIYQSVRQRLDFIYDNARSWTRERNQSQSEMKVLA